MSLILILAKDAADDRTAIVTAENIINPFLAYYNVSQHFMIDFTDFHKLDFSYSVFRKILVLDAFGRVLDKFSTTDILSGGKLPVDSDYIIVGLVNGDLDTFYRRFSPYQMIDNNLLDDTSSLEDISSSSTTSSDILYDMTILNDDDVSCIL